VFEVFLRVALGEDVVGGFGPDEGQQCSFQPTMKVSMAAIGL
jgi:hypothetical protein